MSDSSEDEIFSTRHKRQAKNDLAHLFEERSTESEEEVQPVYDHILLDFFGTGKEYITSKHKKMEQQEKKEMLTVDCYNLLKYEPRAASLLKGDSFMLSFLHRETEYAGQKNIMDMIDINRRVNEYLKLMQMNIEPKYAVYEDCVAMHNYTYDTSNILWKMIISPEALYENALVGQRIHEPVEPIIKITDLVTNVGIIEEIVTLYASHPLFTSTVVHVMAKNIDPVYTLSKYFLHDANMNLSKKKELFETYDEIRCYILNKAIDSVGNLDQKIEYKKQQEAKRRAFKSIVDITLDKILTGCRPLAENEQGMGIFFNKGILYCSIIDYKGRCVKYFQTREIQMVKNNEVAFYAVGSLDKGIKRLINQFSEATIVDLELVHALYDVSDYKAFSTGIARRAYQIEIEYIRAVINKVTIKNDILNNDESADAFELGTRVGLALVGVDVNKLRYNEYSHVVKFINFDSEFVEQVNTYGTIDSLDQLIKAGILMRDLNPSFITKVPLKRPSLISSVFERMYDYDNTCVYLRAPSLFDRFVIHPINYSSAKILCCAVVDEEKDAIVTVLNDPSLLCIDMTEIRKVNPHMDWIGECITHSTRQILQSIPDNIIHEELCGRLKGTVEGKIQHISKTAMFVDCVVKTKNIALEPLFRREKNTIYYDFTGSRQNMDETIFNINVIAKSEGSEYHQNQLVSVNINDPIFSTLSFNGTIIPQVRQKRLKFIDHSLFMDLSAKGIESELSKNNKTLLIRKSSQGTHGIVTIRLFLHDVVVFQHLKFEEIDDKIKFKELLYDDINEMITYFTKKLRIVDKIRKYKGEAEFKLVKDQPGIVKVMLKRGKIEKMENIKIENVIMIGNKRFKTLDEYLKYRRIE